MLSCASSLAPHSYSRGMVNLLMGATLVLEILRDVHIATSVLHTEVHNTRIGIFGCVRETMKLD